MDNYYTEDGFKIVTGLPSDDSDISDAFQQDSDTATFEEESYTDLENASNLVSKEHRTTEKVDINLTKMHNLSKENNCTKVTDDGFKIISEIPSDDSDFSDAFESDLDEDEWIKDKAAYRATGNMVQNGNTNNGSTDNLLLDAATQIIPNNGIRKPLKKIMDDFGITKQGLMDKKRQNSKEEISIKNKCNITLAASLRNNLPVVQIVDHSKKRGAASELGKSNNLKPNQKKPKVEDDLQAFIQASKHDIFKLGMSGLDQVEKKDAKFALAVRLGAKPPKNKVINYKELQKQRKEEKQCTKEKRELDRRLGIQVSRRAEHTEKPKKSKGSVSSSHNVGKFKDGVLTLSKYDMNKIKFSK